MVEKKYKIPVAEKTIPTSRSKRGMERDGIASGSVVLLKNTQAQKKWKDRVEKSSDKPLQVRVSDLLGFTVVEGLRVEQDRTLFFEKISEKPLPSISIKTLQKKISLSNDSFAEVIGISPSSLARYKVGKKIPQKVSEPLVKLAEVTVKGEEVFGSADKFSRWFERPNKQLDGKAPKELLSTHYGHNRVMTLLGRIEWGLFA